MLQQTDAQFGKLPAAAFQQGAGELDEIKIRPFFVHHGAGFGQRSFGWQPAGAGRLHIRLVFQDLDDQPLLLQPGDICFLHQPQDEALGRLRISHDLQRSLPFGGMHVMRHDPFHFPTFLFRVRKPIEIPPPDHRSIRFQMLMN